MNLVDKKDKKKEEDKIRPALLIAYINILFF